MEVQVKVTVELSEDTKQFISGVLGGAKAAPAAKAPKAEAPVKDEAKAPAKEAEAVEEAPARGRRRAAAKEEVAEAPAKEAKAPAKEAAKEEPAAPARRRRAAAKEEPATEDVAFEDLSTDDQLADLQKRITKHTKKGKTSDIKEMLSVFDAGRASELDVKDYVEFSDALARYDAGEGVDEIFPQID